MIRYALLTGLAIATAVAPSAAAAQSAHVHGEGRVNIAIEGNSIFIELESPGADIVGFEHEARTADEQAAVARALAQLGEPMLLMRFAADAKCEVRQASAGIEVEHEEHAEHEHGHEGDQHAEHDEHEHEHEENAARDEHEDEGEHGAFVAEYLFECADIGALGTIEFTYFAEFDNARSLDIVLIDGSGQRRVEIDRARPVLQLNK